MSSLLISDTIINPDNTNSFAGFGTEDVGGQICLTVDGTIVLSRNNIERSTSRRISIRQIIVIPVPMLIYGVEFARF